MIEVQIYHGTKTFRDGTVVGVWEVIKSDRLPVGCIYYGPVLDD